MTLRGRKHTSLVVPPLAALLLALAGCGGGGSPAQEAVATTTVTRTVTTPATTPTTAATGTTTTPAPKPSAPLSLQAAEQVLDAHGYATLTERDWRPDQSLKVLVGIRRGDGPQAELAFLFVGDRFIGTDTKDPSGEIAVADQADTAITLAYSLYKRDDAIDGPTGGTAQVTYRWDGTKLTPQQPIPTASPDAPLSRR